MASAGFGAISNALVALTPLLIFKAEQAGEFAVVYLIFALGWSLTLSIICDAWVRVRGSMSLVENSWEDYSPAASQLAIISGLIGLGAGMVVYGTTLTAVAAAVGIAANVSRLGSRYYRVVSHGPGAVIASDVATIVVFLGVILTLASLKVDLVLALAAAWAISNVIGAGFYRPARWSKSSHLDAWIRSRRHVVGILLKDSILMDAGANLAPLAMMPLMGASGFGIYRAVSSVATPVQLLLDPLRPNISQLPASVVTGRKTFAAIAGAALGMSAAAYAVLVIVIQRWGLFPGVLSDLAHFAIPCALFVAANLVGHFYYICARARLNHRAILTGRVFQTMVSVIFPFGGLLAFNLAGAIWGFALAAVCSGTTWLILVIWDSELRSVAVQIDESARVAQPQPIVEPKP
ncbi:hypothetical protein [Arthrobacter cryoconiti]|nr:hypothetical protein [Arthrobacter cryoconiti]MCC9069030.1 hypothetical protein [Arthrobacter cryoconiti]